MFVTAAYAATAETAEGSFPPFDASTFASQILWLVITFGLFYLFMSRVVLPRIASILETRRDRIAQDLNEANRLKDEADQAFATYEQELADAFAAEGLDATNYGMFCRDDVDGSEVYGVRYEELLAFVIAVL